MLQLKSNKSQRRVNNSPVIDEELETKTLFNVKLLVDCANYAENNIETMMKNNYKKQSAEIPQISSPKPIIEFGSSDEYEEIESIDFEEDEDGTYIPCVQSRLGMIEYSSSHHDTTSSEDESLEADNEDLEVLFPKTLAKKPSSPKNYEEENVRKKRRYSATEDKIIKNGRKNKESWSSITEKLPGRTINSVTSRWQTIKESMKRKATDNMNHPKKFKKTTQLLSNSFSYIEFNYMHDLMRAKLKSMVDDDQYESIKHAMQKHLHSEELKMLFMFMHKCIEQNDLKLWRENPNYVKNVISVL